MNWTDILAALSGPGPTVLAFLLAGVLTVLILRWPAAVGYLTARLTEASSQGALIFCANTVYSLLSGTLDGKAATLLLLQQAYHILMPDGVRSALPPVGQKVEKPSGAAPGASVTGALLMVCVMGMAALGLGACASSSLTVDQISARQANREMVVAAAALNIAYGAMQTPGLSPAVQQDIRAAAQAVTSGIQAQIASLQAGGSATSQVVAGLTGGIEGALPHLGAVLTAARGSTATVEEVAMSAGAQAFSQAPAIVGLLANDLDQTWAPSAAQLQADAAALAAAAAKFAGP